MTMAQSASHAGRRSQHKRRGARVLAAPMIVLGLLSAAAVTYVGYLLWPRWPGAASLDAPTLPVTVADVMFNIPPAAIRQNMQRKSGAHDRLDLSFLWPSLAPPDPAAAVTHVTTETPIDQIHPAERIFLTLSTSNGTLAPEERRKTIYPRYLALSRSEGPAGLTIVAFRANTPYQGEDMIFDAGTPDGFSVRCTRPGAVAIPGTCLYELRVDQADIVVRFPRDWLADWPTVATKINTLMTTIIHRR